MQKVALVGYGFMGQMHSNAYAALPNAELAVVVDVDAAKREAAREKHGAAVVETVDSVLADSSISVVDVCLPTNLHKGYTVRALQAGKSVLCEKPMARTPEDCQEMIAAAASAPGKLMIAQCLRFWPEYAKAKEIMDSGRLGKVESVTCRRVSPRPTWSWENWLQQPERSGGALLDLHVHDIDTIVWMLGKPKAVRAHGIQRGSAWDHVWASYVFEGALAAAAEGAWDYGTGFPFSMSFCIGLEGGAILYDSGRTPTIQVVGYASGVSETPELKKVAASGGATSGNISDMGGYFLEIEYFIGCLESGVDPVAVPLAETALDIRIAFAEMESAASGKTVEL